MQKIELSSEETEQGHPPSSASLASERYIQQVMPPVLRTGDLIASLLLIVYWVSNSSTAASAGAPAFIYWAVGGIFFFLPSIIVTAQLGVIFPGEGAIYLWTYKAMGRFWSSFAGMLWGFPSAIITVNAADGAITFVQGLHPSWLVAPWQQGLAILGFLVLSAVIAGQRTRIVQNLTNMCALLILCATALIAVSAVVWLLSGHGSSTDFVHMTSWSITPSSLGTLGLVTIAYLGVTGPMNMAAEIRGDLPGRRKRITHHLLWGSVVVVACYLMTTWALLVVEGPVNGANPFALVAMVDLVLGKGWGNFTVCCILAAFIVTSGLYYMTFARLVLVASVDQLLPRSLEKLNKNRVPVKAILVQMVIAILFTLMVFIIVPYFVPFNNPADLSNEFYQCGAALVTVIWCFASFFLYISQISLLRKEREILQQHALFPLPVLWITIVIGLVGCGITVGIVLFNSWIPNLISNFYWSLILLGLLVLSAVIVTLASMYAVSEVGSQQIHDELLSVSDQDKKS